MQLRIYRFIQALEPRTLLAGADLDPTFGDGGKATLHYVGGGEEYTTAIAAVGDGRLLVGGFSETGSRHGVLARYLPDGRLDPAFGAGGKATSLEHWLNGVEALAAFPDGSAVAAGQDFFSFQLEVIKLTPSGALDPAWIGPGDAVAGQPQKLLALPAGRSLLFTSRSIARLNANGTLDASFGGAGKVAMAPLADGGSFTIGGAALQGDGRILVAGHASSAGTRAAVRRYLPDGRLDTSFGPGGTAVLAASNSLLRGVVAQPDGRIVVSGSANSGADTLVARLRGDGSPDPAFGNGGVRTFAAAGGTPPGLLVRADGSIVVGGAANVAGAPYLAQLTAAGQLDRDFGGDGIVDHPVPGAWRTRGGLRLAAAPDGRPVVAFGVAPTPNDSMDLTLTRYNNDGTPDTTFGGAPGGVVRTDFPSDVRQQFGRSALQPDGKVVIPGSPTFAPSDFMLARFNRDGTADAAFGNRGDGLARADFGERVELPRDAAVQADGKVLVAGMVVQGDGSTAQPADFAIARFNADGTPDAAFGAGGKVRTDFGGTGEGFSRVTAQADGKILAAGSHGDRGAQTAAVVRYLPNGQLDTGFAAGGRQVIDLPGSGEQIVEVLPLAGGRVLIAGTVGSPAANSAALNHDRFVARLAADGSLDATFGPAGNGVIVLDSGASDETAFGLAAGDGGSLYVAGTCPTAGVTITRLTAAGAVDTAFGSAGSATPSFGGGVPASFIRAPDGKFLFAGSRYVLYGPSGTGGDFLVVRLTPDGAPDATFGRGGARTIDLGRNKDEASDVHLAPDGRIVVTGGSITSAFPPTPGEPPIKELYDYAVVRLAGGSETAPPAVTDVRFTPNHGNQTLQLTFSEDVTSTLGSIDLTVRQIGGNGLRFGASRWEASGDVGGPTSAQWRFHVSSALPDGHYRATIAAADITDSQGNPMAAPFSFDFFVLTGDVNRDRMVNGTDFALLAGSFGKTGMTYGQGDLNGDGAVNGSDFALLAANFGKTMPPPVAAASAQAAPGGAPAAGAMAKPAAARVKRPAVVRRPPPRAAGGADVRAARRRLY